MDKRFDKDQPRSPDGKFGSGDGGAHAILKTAAVHDQMGKLYSSASASYLGQDKIEHSFTVDGAGKPRDIQSSHDSAKSSVTVHPGDQCIIHTHPKRTDPKPSAADIAIAEQFGIPNYELSANELWVANGDGSTAKVGNVEWKDGELVLTLIATRSLRFADHHRYRVVLGPQGELIFAEDFVLGPQNEVTF
jgi:hypothetical protein